MMLQLSPSRNVKRNLRANFYTLEFIRSHTLSGAFWGMLLGLIFGGPFFGMTAGAGIGSVNDEASEYGFNKEYIKEVGQKVTKGTSALFLKTSGAEVDKVADAVKENDWNFEIISTNLTAEHERQLQKDFGAE